MPQTFDTKYSRVVETTDQDLKLDPERFQPVGNQKVFMVAPDGKTHTLPATSAQKAVDAGYKWVSDDTALHNTKVGEHLKNYDGSFKVGLDEGINQILFGVPDIINEHSLSPEELEAKQIARSRHPIARVAGGALGVAGNIAATAGAGELIEGASVLARGAEAASGASKVAEAAEGANLLAKGAEGVETASDAAKASKVVSEMKGLEDGLKVGNKVADAAAPGLRQRLTDQAIQGAKMGAMYSSPQAVAQLAYGDPIAAAETIGMGVGLGGILHLGAGAFSEGLNALKSPIRESLIEQGVIEEGTGKINASKVQQMIDEAQLQKLGISKADAGKLGPDKIKQLAKVVKEGNLGEHTYEDILTLSKEVGESIGEHSKFIDRELPKVQEKSGGIVPTELASKIENKIIEDRPGISTPMFAPEARELKKIIKTISSFGSEPVSFEKLQDIKNLFSDKNANILGKPGFALTPRDRLIKDAYRIIADEQESKMNAAYTAINKVDKFAEYVADKQKYAATKNLLKYGPKPANDFGNPLMGKPTQSLNTPLGKVAEVGTELIGAVPGTIIGGALGHPGMGAYITGHIANKLFAHAAEKKLSDLSIKALQKVADNPESVQWFGAALAKDANHGMLRQIADGANKLTARVAINNDPLKQFLGSSANGLSKDKQYQKVSDTLTHSQVSPEAINQEIELMGSVFNFDPRLKKAVADHQKNTIAYLYKSLPKNPNPPKPYDKSEWKVPPAEKQAFLDKLEVYNNPWSIMNHVGNGTLNNNHLEALDSLYPQQKQQMIGIVAKMAHDPDAPKLSLGTKLQLSKLTGIDLLNMDGINYQSAYAGTQAMPPEAKQPKSHQVKQTKFQKMPSFDTEVSRRDHKNNAGL